MNYNETVPRLMSDVSMMEFIVAHAENHLQNLQWMALKGLHINKRNVVNAMPNEKNSIKYYERVANIFTNYRRGVLNMEYCFNEQSKIFINKLKKRLNEAKNQIQNETNNTYISEVYSNEFVNKMFEFDALFKNEYNRIIPIIFPENENIHGNEEQTKTFVNIYK